MSKERYLKDLKEFPVIIKDGQRHCRWCQQPIKPPRKSFCSDKCSHELQLRISPSYVRYCLKKRDKEICAICHLDCRALRIKLRALYKTNKNEWLFLIKKYKIPKGRRHKSLWDADHIVPVSEGGGLCDLSNYRILCISCHRIETAKLRARRKRKK